MQYDIFVEHDKIIKNSFGYNEQEPDYIIKLIIFSIYLQENSMDQKHYDVEEFLYERF